MKHGTGRESGERRQRIVLSIESPASPKPGRSEVHPTGVIRVPIDTSDDGEIEAARTR